MSPAFRERPLERLFFTPVPTNLPNEKIRRTTYCLIENQEHNTSTTKFFHSFTIGGKHEKYFPNFCHRYSHSCTGANSLFSPGCWLGTRSSIDLPSGEPEYQRHDLLTRWSYATGWLEHLTRSIAKHSFEVDHRAMFCI